MSVFNHLNSNISLKLFNMTKFFVVMFTLYVLVFGLFQFGAVSIVNGKTANCPFSNHSMSICAMNPTEHIQEWQSMFTSLPVKNSTSTILAFLFLALLGTVMSRNLFQSIEVSNLYRRFFSRNNFQIQDSIKEAFSNGLLNPKLF